MIIDDIIKSIKANLYERATSPLFGTFVVAWCVCNYKFLVVLVSSMPVASKFEYIETDVYTTAWVFFLKGVVCPLIATVFFIFIYPIPAKFVYEFWRKRQKELKEIKQKIEDETPLTLEESRKIRNEIITLQSSHDSETQRYNSEIEKLKTDNEFLTTENSSLKLRTKALKPQDSPDELENSRGIEDLNEDEIRILTQITKEEGGVAKDFFIQNSPYGRVKTEVIVQKLVDNRYLTFNANIFSDKSTYSLTSAAAKLMIKKRIAK